ncbi:MAG: hypothetical protein WD066_19320 [Planctomycetaceae bacterium]
MLRAENFIRTAWPIALAIAAFLPVVAAAQDGDSKEAASGTEAAAQTESGAKPAAPRGIPEPPELSTAAEDEAAAAEAAAKKAARLEKISQLTFDRRPSAILRAWSGMAEPDSDDPPQGEESDSPAVARPAVVASAAGRPIRVVSPGPVVEVFPSGATHVLSSATGALGGASTSGNEGAADDPFAKELAAFQRNVTLGQWEDVKKFIAGLPEDEGKALYKQLLEGLHGGPVMTEGASAEVLARMQQMMAMQGMSGGQEAEANYLAAEDIVALAAARPGKLADEHLAVLGELTRKALAQGQIVERLLALLRDDIARPETEAAFTRRQTAQLLFRAGRPEVAAEFLPDLAAAEREKDHEGLNLLARHFIALHAKDAKAGRLEQAWKATQAVLASRELRPKERDEALLRCVELASKVRDELGQAWLDKSFTDEPQRGMEILATIGGATASAMQMHGQSPDVRLKQLELQTAAVESLLRAAPERAGEWRTTLELLAHNWLREAVFSYHNDESTSLGPSLRRDVYGNLFYFDEMQMMGMRHHMGRNTLPVETGKLLGIEPGREWIEHLQPGLRPRFDVIGAQLYLKVAEEDKAFPCIERLAASHPEQARELMDEFLTVWTRNHDPNAERRHTNPYMFMYGFERRAESIPLTRSKQERNLEELTELVRRLDALELGDVKEELLAKAFTTCHSSAEVYRLEAIEKVFGPIDGLQPGTLAELAQQMRTNLAGVWRAPAVQERNKTRRKQKDIEAEVLRGYEGANAVLANARRKHPDDWSLSLAAAALTHDENDFRNELAPSSEFTERRRLAFDSFARAAANYAAQLPEISEDERTIRAFELWFDAALGACELGRIDEKTLPDLRQFPLIRDAILALPEDAAESHMTMFANSLVTRINAVKPAVKSRYLNHGFEIVGDHEHAREVRRIHLYYQDLVTEVRLECAVDGGDVVGSERPFGVFVNLRHTREIERESGGFGRYLQNQSTGANYFFYNYGRPLENYRDKFEELARQALAEHFDILSVTFQSEDVTSKATGEYGWRVTPYAYLLLKARGKEVDKLPPLQLHLDFLDTSGYVVLPIESPAVPVDAAHEPAEPRPFGNVTVTQILDERQAAEGKLILEVKAAGHGLVPELDRLVELEPQGFVTAAIDDQGVSVSKFDPDADDTRIASERNWMITFTADAAASEMPAEFHFATPAIDGVEMVRQRYADADLLPAEAVVRFENRYGTTRRGWMTWLAAAVGLLVVAVGGVVSWRLMRRPRVAAESRFELPGDLTPFTVLGLLRNIQQNDGLDDGEHHELTATIDRLERHYFATADGDEPDLPAIAKGWLTRTAGS